MKNTAKTKENTPVKVKAKEVAPVKVDAKKKAPQMQSSGIDESRTYLYETKTRELATRVLEDGYVSPSEKLEMEDNHGEIIRDFLVATDILEKMEKNPNVYSPAEFDAVRFVVARLKRARELSMAKLQEIKYANRISPEEKAKRKQRRQHFNLYQIFALDGGAHEVVDYARKEETKGIMTPEERQKTEKRIMKLVNLIIEKGKDARYIQQFLENDKEQVL